MSRNERRTRARRRWLKEVGLAAAVFALPLLVLFPYPWFRPDADFDLRLTTRSISFALADGYRGDDLLTREPHELVVGDRSYQDAKTSLDLSNVESVRLDWAPAAPAGVRIVLRRQRPSAQPWGVVRAGDAVSKIESGADTLALSIDRSGIGSLPPLTDVLPLRNGSSLEFVDEQAAPAIVGRDGVVNIAETDDSHGIHGGDEVTIAQLQEAKIGSLSVAHDGIHVEAIGRAGTLRVRGDDLRPSWVERLRANNTVETYVSTAILIGTVLYTLLTRLKLVRLEKES
jgi:hypothetical protein